MFYVVLEEPQLRGTWKGRDGFFSGRGIFRWFLYSPLSFESLPRPAEGISPRLSGPRVYVWIGTFLIPHVYKWVFPSFLEIPSFRYPLLPNVPKLPNVFPRTDSLRYIWSSVVQTGRRTTDTRHPGHLETVHRIYVTPISLPIMSY